MVAASKVDRGRTVTAARPIPVRSTGGTERGSRPSLLVIDDNSRVRTVVSWHLEAEGYLVREAADGNAACQPVGISKPATITALLSAAAWRRPASP